MCSLIEKLVDALPELHSQHAPGCKTHAFLKAFARREIERLFSDPEPQQQRFSPFGSLVFPYHKMGAVDSLNLFDIDELILFAFYWVNRRRYRRVADVGANIGLHSVIMDRCGFQVRSYEPDSQHYSKLLENLRLNHCDSVETYNAAASSRAGEMVFVRVLGNTTSSHLDGSKAKPYGELERFPVKLESIDSIAAWADLVKLDAEGHEKQIVLATQRDHWLHTDAMIEIENPANAAALYEHFAKLEINLFSQKTGWQLVKRIEDLPTNYKEGMLFVSYKDEMPWG